MALKASSLCALVQPALEKTLGSKWTSIPPSAGRKMVGPALVMTDWQRPEPKSGRVRLEELLTANLLGDLAQFCWVKENNVKIFPVVCK